MEPPQEQLQTMAAPIAADPSRSRHEFPIFRGTAGITILLLVCTGGCATTGEFPHTSAGNATYQSSLTQPAPVSADGVVTWVPFSRLRDPYYRVSNDLGEIYHQRETAKDVFEDADPKTLEFATTPDGSVAGYAKDATHVYSFSYYWVHKISDVDLQTFTVLPFPNDPNFVIFAKDKSNVYVGSDRIDGADSETFVTMAAFEYAPDGSKAYYAKDRSHVYFFNGVSLTNERPIAVLPGADAATFVNVSPNVFKDKNHVYGMNYEFYAPDCVTCQQADSKTFVALDGGYFKDKNHFYFWSKILEDISATTFSVLGDSGYAKDSQHVYVGGEILSPADPDTFKLIDGYGGWYAIDRSHVFIRGTVVDELDPGSLVIINQAFAKDVDTVWLTLPFDPAGAMPDADPSTFEVLPIEGTQAGTFAPIDSEWSKDATHVYFLDTLLPDADPKSFAALSGRLGKDLLHVYCMERLVPGADPATFVASSTDAWSGQDKAHKYDCEKVEE